MFTALLLSVILTAPIDESGVALLAYQAEVDEHNEAVHEFDDDFPTPKRLSYAAWLFRALGIRYSVLLPLSGFVIFCGACYVVAFARPAVIASYLVLLPLPLLIGLYAVVEGFVIGYTVISNSTTIPNPSEFAAAISGCLAAALVGFLVNAPAYFVIAFGLPLRVHFTRQDKSV